MKYNLLAFSLAAFCFVAFSATAQVTKGLHFYFPFNEGKGDVAKDIGPKGFEAELHKSAKFTDKVDVLPSLKTWDSGVSNTSQP